jgi:methionyl-tRNA formyltransferase
MKVHFLSPENSWILPFVESLISDLQNLYTEVFLYHDHNQLPKGDLLFILGYLRIIPKDILQLHKHNLVIHESDLPKGKGFSPMSWQIAGGFDQITFSLFEAEKDLDSGDIYLQKELILEGNELFPEWRDKQGKLTCQMVKEFLRKYPEIEGKPQRGLSSIFRQRNHNDDQLNIDISIKENFDLLRVCDPENYPAWFSYKNRKYKVYIKPWEI